MIAIFLNSKEWGGVDILVSRFANYLSSRGVEYCIIEPAGGYLRKGALQARFIEPAQVNLIAKQATHLVVPTISKLRDPLFPWELLSHVKLLTWVVHPNDPFSRFFPLSGLLSKIIGYRAVPLLRRGFPSHTSLLDSLFKKLTEKKALIVMDGATRRALRFFYPTLSADPKIVPIPSPIISTPFGRRKRSQSLNIGYLGRMDEMKWSAIKPLIIHEIAPLTKSKKILLHLVSDGSCLPRLEKLCSKIGIEVHSYGSLPNQQARELMVEKTDLAIAMGTSALDLAGCGHPCVMLDPSLGLFSSHQKRFRFVHESEEHTLGEYRDFPYYVESSHAFQEILQMASLESVSRREKMYVQAEHDPISCFDLLMNRLFESTLKLSDVSADLHALARSFNSVKARPLTHISAISIKNIIR